MNVFDKDFSLSHKNTAVPGKQTRTEICALNDPTSMPKG